MGGLMDSSKKMIKLYLALVFLSALLAYLVSLNAEIHMVSCPVAGLSNEFAFTICSGVLAGGFVALAAEVSRLLDGRQKTIDSMYIAAVGARRALRIVCRSSEEVVCYISKMFNSFAETARGEIDGRLEIIFFSGYGQIPFDEGVGEAWKAFNREIRQPDLFYRRCSHVQQAVLEQKIRLCQNGQMSFAGCPADDGVRQAVDALLAEANRIDAALGKLIAVLSNVSSAGAKNYVSSCEAEQSDLC